MAARKRPADPLTGFLVACAAEADPRVRIKKARGALASLPRGNKRAQAAVHALLAHARIDAAERDYRAATKLASRLERAEVYAVLARFYVRHHRAEDALKLLRSAARRVKNPLLSVALAYVEARISGDPTPLLRFRGTLEKKQKSVPLYAYFLGFLNLWDGRTLDAVKTLRGFVSRGVDQMGAWGRELAPELDHARRTILQVEAVARVPMP